LDLLVMGQGARGQLAMSLYMALPEGGFGMHFYLTHILKSQMFIPCECRSESNICPAFHVLPTNTHRHKRRHED